MLVGFFEPVGITRAGGRGGSGAGGVSAVGEEEGCGDGEEELCCFFHGVVFLSEWLSGDFEAPEEAGGVVDGGGEVVGLGLVGAVVGGGAVGVGGGGAGAEVLEVESGFEFDGEAFVVEGGADVDDAVGFGGVESGAGTLALSQSPLTVEVMGFQKVPSQSGVAGSEP